MRKQWEYMVTTKDLYNDSAKEYWLNEKGLEGWELVTHINDIGTDNWIFKREKR